MEAFAVPFLLFVGAQVASVFIDRFGLLRLPRPIWGLRLGAVGALLAGVRLIQLA
jgi:uncharacterized membrane protein YdcZ (DUF606 family)